MISKQKVMNSHKIMNASINTPKTVVWRQNAAIRTKNARYIIDIQISQCDSSGKSYLAYRNIIFSIQKWFKYMSTLVHNLVISCIESILILNNLTTDLLLIQYLSWFIYCTSLSLVNFVTLCRSSRQCLCLLCGEHLCLGIMVMGQPSTVVPYEQTGDRTHRGQTHLSGSATMIHVK